MPQIACTSCGLPYPETEIPYRCPRCGGVFDYLEITPYRLPPGGQNISGYWEQLYALGFPGNAPPVHLGEGQTPLIWSQVINRQVAFKCEYQNPTGSFKDRGSAALMSILKLRQAGSLIEDSSGNAGASLAAYAARAGLKLDLYIPDSASGSKKRQAEIYGARLVRIMGPRSNTAVAAKRGYEKAVEEAKANGSRFPVYASHAHLPFNLLGYATLAVELVQQLGNSPGTILLPVGQGGLLLGLGRGFQALHAAGMIDSVPQIIGIQVNACAPLWAVFQYGTAGLNWSGEEQSLAEGIRVAQPVRGDAVLQMMADFHGEFCIVEEETIISGMKELARLGFYVEPTSAVVWDILTKDHSWKEPIVVILTGSGLKFSGAIK